MAFQKQQPLDERIKVLRAEIDALIDERAVETKKDCPGVPLAVIRNSITRGSGCECRQYLQIKRLEDEETARAVG